MQWVQDPKVEAKLKAMKITFSIETIPLEKIDRKESLNRQSRLEGKLIDELALSYGISMERPDAAFPMIVLNEYKKGTYLILSGNHRTAAAHLCGFKDLRCYVVHIDDPMLLDMFPRMANCWEGRALSREERLINARFLHEKYKLPVEELASMVGLRKDAIHKDQQAEEVRSTIKNLGASAKDIPQSTLIRMRPLAANHNVLKETARVITHFKLAGTQADQLIQDVKRGNTEHACMAELTRWKATLEKKSSVKDTAAAGAVVVLRERRAFLKLLTSMERFVETHKTMAQCQCSDSDAADVVKKSAKKIIAGLHAIIDSD